MKGSGFEGSAVQRLRIIGLIGPIGPMNPAPLNLVTNAIKKG
jgi:hypothetical protein